MPVSDAVASAASNIAVGALDLAQSLVNASASLVVPGSNRRTVDVGEDGMTLAEFVFKATGGSVSDKANYLDQNGQALKADSIVAPGSVVTSVRASENG